MTRSVDWRPAAARTSSYVIPNSIGCRVHWSSFFFSSRRRHTRYWRDWSSDVCSSDLEPLKVLTKRWDVPDGHTVEGYVRTGGYAGLRKALDMAPSTVMQEVKDSGLRGQIGRASCRERV